MKVLVGAMAGAYCKCKQVSFSNIFYHGESSLPTVSIYLSGRIDLTLKTPFNDFQSQIQVFQVFEGVAAGANT